MIKSVYGNFPNNPPSVRLRQEMVSWCELHGSLPSQLAAAKLPEDVESISTEFFHLCRMFQNLACFGAETWFLDISWHTQNSWEGIMFALPDINSRWVCLKKEGIPMHTSLDARFVKCSTIFRRLVWNRIPSGKRLHNYEQSPFFLRKTHYFYGHV